MAENCTEIVSALLDKGAKTDLSDTWGNTPLSDALSNQRVDIAAALIGKGVHNTGCDACTASRALMNHEFLRTFSRGTSSFDAGAIHFSSGGGSLFRVSLVSLLLQVLVWLIPSSLHW